MPQFGYMSIQIASKTSGVICYVQQVDKLLIHPMQKIEVLTALPPVKIQVKAIIVKFLVKNLLRGNEDMFLKDIKQHVDTPKHFSSQHRMFVQEYIAMITGARSAHTIDIWEYKSLKYNKDNI